MFLESSGGARYPYAQVELVESGESCCLVSEVVSSEVIEWREMALKAAKMRREVGVCGAPQLPEVEASEVRCASRMETALPFCSRGGLPNAQRPLLPIKVPTANHECQVLDVEPPPISRCHCHCQVAAWSFALGNHAGVLTLRKLLAEALWSLRAWRRVYR